MYSSKNILLLYTTEILSNNELSNRETEVKCLFAAFKGYEKGRQHGSGLLPLKMRHRKHLLNSQF